MASTKKPKPTSDKKRSVPKSVRSREQQIISLAEDLAEERIGNGTASSQLITHYLKLGTERAKLENEKLKEEVEMLKAKTKQLESQRNIEEMYGQALEAMQLYSGGNEL
jgi:hypothetical protein